jgi:serine/threonine protein kinase
MSVRPIIQYQVPILTLWAKLNLCDNPSMPDHSASPPPPPPRPLKLPLKAFGGYEIEGELGRGGMGVVYLARQIELNRHVALKMLTGHYGPDELQRFLEEAETAAALSHSNIVHIYEVGEHEGAPFFSMEYVKAGSLADSLRKELPAPRDAAQLLIEVARALHFAHQNGVVHRDMKPANILLGPDNEPKVTDFGIAKRLEDDTNLTRSGAVLGTPTYMAPEQAKGHSRHAGPSADIYSLGAILYEMLTGRPPFLPEDSETAITVRVLTEDLVSPAWHRPEIPRDLETICMKCLQKEPRNRYASAAALAEDLRRFLDDEPILAKPPSTVVSSIRWVRRNPWKFVAAATVLLLVVVGLVRLAQWELYQRPHLEYATQVVWANGVLEPLEKISEDAASHRAAYLRLTRRGLFGPITKVEVLNARGHPAELRRVFNDEMIPIYTEGLTGVQPYEERQRESTSVEFSFDDSNSVLEAIGRDRNSQVNWRLIYEHPVASGSVGARFVDLRGFDAKGASHLEFERDAKGRDVKITFFNVAGWPAANGEGVYGYKLEYNDAGRITQLINLGADGQPAANRAGLIAFTTSWGKEVRSEVHDAKGQPALWYGIAAIVTEQDSAGNPVRLTNLATDGKPVRDAAAYWSVKEMKRNEHGELTQYTFFKADANGALKQLSQTNISYDDFGYPVDIQLVGETSSRIAWRRDANGNITEEKLLDAKGQPITGNNGYAIKRITYTTSAQGVRVEETYFDAAGEKTYSKAGYHRLIKEYDAAGPLRRMIEDEHDPAQYKYYRYVNEMEFTSQWRLRHSIFRYEDAQGQLADKAGTLYTLTEEFYDENGRLTTEWRTASDPKNFGGPVLRFDTEWYADGKKKRQVRQVCDENRQPLSFISTGSPAHSEEEFDENEQWVRIYETGFDESLVGFGTREAKFSGGNIQSVTHTRSDGTVLNSVDVIIIGVVPPQDQPKSAELKAGDQILAANGKPVTSAYALLPAGGFPGGSIEVLREGQRIRIDGFVHGSLGVAMQERARPQ